MSVLRPGTMPFRVSFLGVLDEQSRCPTCANREEPPMSDSIARRLVVHGRVQGVFFRAETRQQARDQGVNGWVANRPDGTVEAWLQGSADAVDAVEGWIRAGGPSRASVDRVEADDAEVTDHDSFEVRG